MVAAPGIRQVTAAGRWRPATGGSAFAETPDRAAPDARLLWHADLDPAVLPVRAEPVTTDDPDGFDLARLERWTVTVQGAGGVEHVAVSDGWRRIRVDVVEGRLIGAGPVRLHYLLSGFSRIEPGLLTTRRLVAFWRSGRFVPTLFPGEPGMFRRIEALRVADAVAAGATNREIAVALFGEERVRAEWKGRSDYLLSRVRRRIVEARQMARGGWRALLAR
jgi:hypothetical protein